MKAYLFLGLLLVPFFIQSAEAQIPISVNATQPCFLNATAGWEIFKNCGARDDYITFALLPWQWITGGWFSMIFVSLLIAFTYIKYQKIAYPMMIGAMFLPVSFFLFPEVFLSFMFVMFGLGCCVLVWYAFIKQSKEY